MLTRLIPLALVIALSPITVIPAVLVLHAPRPRPASLAFLGGWLLGLVALTAVFVGASDLLGDLREAPPTWASWVRVVLGSAMIALGIFRWLTRHRQRDTPRWMRPFAKLTPVRAGVTGGSAGAAEARGADRLRVGRIGHRDWRVRHRWRLDMRCDLRCYLRVDGRDPYLGLRRCR